MLAVNAEGIPCMSGSCPDIAGEKAFANTPRPDRPGNRPTAARLGETSLMFLVHPTLSVDDMADTIQAVSKVMRVATA